MNVTIKEVAALAGVSPSTVSRTCNNSPLISQKTQEKVRKAMKELGYEPPVSLPAAAPARTPGAIGIILPPSEGDTFENTFFLEVVRGISLYCNQRSYVNTLITGKDENEIIESIANIARHSSIQSFILLFSRENDPIMEYLHDESIPFVLVGSPLMYDAETVCVDNDNIAAGKEAVEHLIRLGHRSIAFIGSGKDQVFSMARRSGYIIALSQNNIPIHPELNLEVSLSSKEDIARIRALLSLPAGKRPTAAACCDDLHALMVRQLCEELGLRIPQDFSLVSFNNSIFARLCSPAVTSIDVNAMQLGMEAASQAINHLENPDLMPARTLVPYSLAIRDSSGPVPSKTEDQ